MGMFDKRRFRKLLLFVLNFDVRNPRTCQDVVPDKMTTRDLFSRFDLGPDVMEFTGHAIALHSSERSVTRVICINQKRIWKNNDRWSFKLKPSWSGLLSPGDPAVTWTSRVGKPSDGSSCTLSLCPSTTPVHTSTLCTGWENYHRDLPGYKLMNHIFPSILSTKVVNMVWDAANVKQIPMWIRNQCQKMAF